MKSVLCRLLPLLVLASCGLAKDTPREVSDLLVGETVSDESKSDSVADSNWLWPGGNIYALVQARDSDDAPAFGAKATGLLRQAAKELEEQTPVRIYYIDETWEAASGYYVDVMGDGDPDHISGVASVGTANSYATWFGLYGELHLKADADISVLRHELGHVVGLWHTQRRADRGEHITVHWDQVKDGFDNQFTTSDAASIGPYDTNSIMHYSSYTFARDKSCAVITKNSTSESCDLQSEHLIAEPINYTVWNYVTLSALYCLPRHCGDNCASPQRCSAPAVKRNLKRLAHWERTGERKLPADQAICGDGYVDGDEECDSPDYCDANCTRLECGDGIVNFDTSEQCDDSGESSACNIDCSLSRCGDGIINRSAGETCDAETETTACDSDCTRAYCGDGIVNLVAGEECDGEIDCLSSCKLTDDLYGTDSSGCTAGNAGSGSNAALLLLAMLGLLIRRKRSRNLVFFAE